MIRNSVNAIPIMIIIGIIIVLFIGNFLIAKLPLNPSHITMKPLPTPQLIGPIHPCANNLKKHQSLLPKFIQTVEAHTGEGYDRWGIRINIDNAYPCKYFIEFKVEEPYQDWSYIQEVSAYAFPDQIVRFQPPAEVASAEISIYAITSLGKTNSVTVDSLEFWEGIHQFPIDPKLGEVNLSTLVEKPVQLTINKETKLLEVENQ